MGSSPLRLLPALLLALLVQTATVAAAASLQELIDATPAGGVLKLAPGNHVGPATISKPMTLDGAGRAGIVGPGRGTVLSVAANGVTLRGLRIVGSGESHDGVDAGILLEGDGHAVENNVIEDVLFGIHLKQVNHARASRGNTIRGRPLGTQPARRRASACGTAASTRIEGNLLDGRDLTIANSRREPVLSATPSSTAATGCNVMFSPRNAHRGQSGQPYHHRHRRALFGPDTVARQPCRARALTWPARHWRSRAAARRWSRAMTLLHCTVGIQTDAPPNPEAPHRFIGNRLAHNVTGMYFYGEKGGHVVRDNQFLNNLLQVGVSGATSARDNDWHGNYWDDYRGFDRDGDGIGDTPHTVHYYADRIWMETPQAVSFAIHRCWNCWIFSNAWRRSRRQT
jgi:nitrous oxidase accessory protein